MLSISFLDWMSSCFTDSVSKNYDFNAFPLHARRPIGSPPLSNEAICSHFYEEIDKK
jgi:hypothetical protein